jgi:hypothetical protein
MLRMPCLRHLQTYEDVRRLLPLTVLSDQFQTAQHCQVVCRFGATFPTVRMAMCRPNSICGVTIPAKISCTEYGLLSCKG